MHGDDRDAQSALLVSLFALAAIVLMPTLVLLIAALPSTHRSEHQPTRLEVAPNAGDPYDGRHSFASLLLHETGNVA